MNYWIIADTHLGDKGLINAGIRPKDFTKRILSCWNGNVRDDDIVIVLGDVITETEHHNTFKTLKGKKILVKGNHDKKTNHWYLTHGFDFVCDKFEMTFEGVNLVFSHMPIEHDKDVCICGHLHLNTPTTKSFNFLISLEKMGYGVHSLKSVMKKVKKLL